MRHLLFLVMIQLIFSCSNPQKSEISNIEKRTINEPLTEFPFEIRDDDQLYVKVKVNETDSLTFNIDTGAESFVIVDSIAKNRLKLNFDGEDINIGASSVIQIKSSSKNKITIGNIDIDNVKLYSIPYKNVDFDGIIASEFFLNYVVSINYDRMTIKVYDPKTFKYDGEKSKLKVKMKDGRPLIQASFKLKDTLIKDWFLLDTGADDQISFNSPAVKNLDLDKNLSIIGSATSKDANGNLSKSALGLVREIEIGGFSFYNLIGGLANDQKGSNTDEDHLGAFGNVVLSKMNIIYDLSNNCLYLEPKYFN